MRPLQHNRGWQGELFGVGGQARGAVAAPRELRESFDRNAYRLVYVVNLRKALYVLHAFMKKSKSGVGLPKPDAALIETRLRRARETDAE